MSRRYGALKVENFAPFCCPGANPDAPDAIGATALVHACMHGDVDLVRALLQVAGANPNVFGYRGYSPLLYAKLGRHDDVVKLLVDHGADEAYADRQYASALARTESRAGYESKAPVKP